MEKKSIRDAAWYPMAVAACIGVAFYILLSQFPELWASVLKFLGNFKPLFLGCAIAYIVNPLANTFEKRLTFVKGEEKRRSLANALAFAVVVIFLIFFVVILVPQLIASVELLAGNLDSYIATVTVFLENLGLNMETFDLTEVLASSESIIASVSQYLVNNMETIMTASASAGRNVFQWGIAFIMSIYLLGEKGRLMGGLSRLLKALAGEKKYEGISTFLGKCDLICSRYIVFNLIDSAIVGGANAIFMTLMGMQYTGLISVIVGITNLIPTFGPMIGAVVGGFILLMVKPMDALIFLGFTLILQTVDGYVLKPRLFGNSLGVSGLWILVGVIVGGNMFGVLGILLAVPGVAIIDFIYGSYLIPWLEERRKKLEAK